LSLNCDVLTLHTSPISSPLTPDPSQLRPVTGHGQVTVSRPQNHDQNVTPDRRQTAVFGLYSRYDGVKSGVHLVSDPFVARAAGFGRVASRRAGMAGPGRAHPQRGKGILHLVRGVVRLHPGATAGLANQQGRKGAGKTRRKKAWNCYLKPAMPLGVGSARVGHHPVQARKGGNIPCRTE